MTGDEPFLPAETNAESGRLLFRYITGDEWQEYRQIMAVFAGTFFSDFTPDEVELRLADSGVPFPEGVVPARLESLRRWGNLTVSSVTGTPASLADYYRRRNRYLITRAGQEVHEAVEGVITRIDEVRDVSTGRLRSLIEALRSLAHMDVDSCDPDRLAEMVRAVFDPHQAFTSEITQFFAAINQWQNRYDLNPEEFSFFAQVLVGYVTDRLGEIERASRPVAAALSQLADSFQVIADRANRGLAARVEEAGLAGAVSVSRAPGTSVEDWQHLNGWFVGAGQRPARIEQLRRDAVAAVRTLTLNLTRLSRVGLSGSSRRADLLRLARIVSERPEGAADLVNAGFGLFAPDHYGSLGADADDAVSIATSWFEAPQAAVPLSLRERGDTAARGNASPLPDRAAAQQEIRRRREQEMAALRRADAELVVGMGLDGHALSPAALHRLQLLIGRALSRMPVDATDFSFAEGSVALTLTRMSAGGTVVRTTAGTLSFARLRVAVSEELS